jgi:putative hydrolase of the HAD superfamily
VIEAVTFDYWNTLCYEPEVLHLDSLRVAAVTRLLADAGVDEPAGAEDRVRAAMADARARYWDAWVANRQFTAAEASAAVATALADVAPTGTSLADQIVEAFDAVGPEADLLLVEGVADAVDALHRRGVRIGIVCDVGLLPSRWLRHHLAGHGLLDLFDHWSFSDEVGVYKPDRRIFEHALAGLGGVPATATAHVGDRRRTDVAGAMAMGMRAVRVTAVYDDDDADEGPSGDAVIAEYGELLPALGLG